MPTNPVDYDPCPSCGAKEYEPGFYCLCEPCSVRWIREHPERRLIVDGTAIRFVLPADEPPGREPKSREPDDITDPWEYAEHHGLPDPEDVAAWVDPLEQIHYDEPGIFLDKQGHLFGPIEHLAGVWVLPRPSAAIDPRPSLDDFDEPLD